MEPTQEQTNQPPKNNMNMGIIAVVVIAILAAGVFLFEKKGNMSSSQANTSKTSTYKDGTYTVEGNYTTHAGPEKIKVTLVIKNDMISDSTVEEDTQSPMSKRFQGLFISGYKELVVGKKITEVQLDKVSGSSLTPKGFMDAIQQIEAQAKA